MSDAFCDVFGDALVRESDKSQRACDKDALCILSYSEHYSELSLSRRGGPFQDADFSLDGLKSQFLGRQGRPLSKWFSSRGLHELRAA